MKTLAILFYTIGAALLIASCFTTGFSITWWLGGTALVLLILGCVIQFNVKKRELNQLIEKERQSHFVM